DHWALIRWNGFRPRAKGLDEPVQFDVDPTDSLANFRADSVIPPVVPRLTPSISEPPPAREEPAADRRIRVIGWTLSFAALLDEKRARDLAGTIHLDTKAVRVVPGTRERVTIWRVVAGPYPSRDEAERAGRRTGLPFWVY